MLYQVKFFGLYQPNSNHSWSVVQKILKNKLPKILFEKVYFCIAIYFESDLSEISISMKRPEKYAFSLGFFMNTLKMSCKVFFVEVFNKLQHASLAWGIPYIRSQLVM